MKIFPALRPTDWEITLGSRPSAESKPASGRVVVVSLSKVEVGRTLQRTFHLTRAELMTLRDFLEEIRYPFLQFDLPPEVAPASYTPAGYAWKIASEVAVQDVAPDFYVVTIVFACVPKISMAQPGTTARIIGTSVQGIVVTT